MNEFSDQPPTEVPATEVPAAEVPPTEVPAAEVPAVAAPRPRRRLGRVLTATVLAAAVVAGVGYTGVTVAHADRDPGKPVWTFPDRHKEAEPQAKGLRGMLLPFEKYWGGFQRGPDIAEFGYDTELTGAEATALRKQSIHDLPPRDRRKFEKLIDEEHIKGMAMRSYATEAGYGDGRRTVTAGIELVRMDRGSARTLSDDQREVFASVPFFRKGPKIDGHPNAACFLTRKIGKEKFDHMFCTAYAGDVLVTVKAAGTHPVETNTLALFIGRQLDRIKDPGKAV